MSFSVPQNTIFQLLRDLRGGGFNTSIVLPGVTFNNQKVVSFENGVVFTVQANGVVRATEINEINSVDF